MSDKRLVSSRPGLCCGAFDIFRVRKGLWFSGEPKKSPKTGEAHGTPRVAHTPKDREKEREETTARKEKPVESPPGMERSAFVVAVAAACRSTAGFVLTPHTPRVQLSTSGGTNFVQPDPRYACRLWLVRMFGKGYMAVHKCACAGRVFGVRPSLFPAYGRLLSRSHPLCRCQRQLTLLEVQEMKT